MAQQQISGARYLGGHTVSDNYGLGGFPPDVAVEEQALNRKQQIANLLLQQGLQGAGGGQMVGRFYVPTSGTQHAAKIGELLAGLVGTHAVDKKREALSTDMNEERARAVAEHAKNTKQKQVELQGPGAPQLTALGQQLNKDINLDPRLVSEQERQALAERTPDVAAEGPRPMGTAEVPLSSDEQRAKVVAALSHPDPRVREAVKFMEQAKAHDEEKKAAQAFMAQQNEENRTVRREGIEANALMRLEQMKQNASLLEMNIASKEQMGQNADALKKQLAEQNAALQKELHRLDAQSRETVAKIGAEAKQNVAEMKAGSKGKLPAAIGSKFMENSQNLRMAENALDLIGKHKDATGVKGYLPDPLLQRIDPKGVDTRAAVANLGSMVIHDRSGAAVTASEFPRLRPFIPSATDAPDVVKKKLTQFVTEYKKINQEMTEFYKESGYDIPENWHQPGGSAETQTLPEGAKQIGTSGGKPVYQLPDGSKVIAE